MGSLRRRATPTHPSSLSLHVALPTPPKLGGEFLPPFLIHRDALCGQDALGMKARNHFTLKIEAVRRVRSVERIPIRSEEHTSELQSLRHLVCRLLLEKKKKR